MKTFRNILMLAVGIISLILLPSYLAASGDAANSREPYFTPATPGLRAPGPDGFLQRWLILEPIAQNLRSNAGFNETYIRNTFNTEYFPNQFTLVPKDGDKVTVNEQALKWHAVDATGFNVKLFRFAEMTNHDPYGVLFWVVTVVESPRDIENVRMAVGSNSASIWWVNGEEAVHLFGDRRMVMDDCVSKRLTLKKGKNIIRGAIINGPGMSDFCVRFLDEEGNAIKYLNANLAPASN